MAFQPSLPSLASVASMYAIKSCATVSMNMRLLVAKLLTRASLSAFQTTGMVGSCTLLLYEGVWKRF